MLDRIASALTSFTLHLVAITVVAALTGCASMNPGTSPGAETTPGADARMGYPAPTPEEAAASASSSPYGQTTGQADAVQQGYPTTGAAALSLRDALGEATGVPMTPSTTPSTPQTGQ